MPTAIVTGAAIRIGKAIALHLAAKGFNIALHYHRSEPSTVIEEIKSKGVYCQSYPSDLSNLDEAEQFIAKIITDFDDVELLGMNRPVTHVCWYEAQAWCNWAARPLVVRFYFIFFRV